MARGEWQIGQTATYEGIMLKRRGQRVEIVNTGDLIACKFPDGAVIGCASNSLQP